MNGDDPKTPESIWPLIARHLAGETNAADEAILRQWLAADPDRVAMVDELREAWSVPPDSAARFDGPSLRQAVLRRVRERSRAASRAWTVRITAAAAAVLIACGAVVVWRLGMPREYIARAGQRRNVTLADGTHLVLGPASKLTVPVSYGHTERRVSLEGEGFFTVAHDASRPFAIRTDRGVMRDIGTAFVVRAYPRDAVLRVAVTDGIVAVDSVRGAAPSAEWRLGPTTAFDLDRMGRISITRRADLESDVAWSQGRLAFRDTPLIDVASTLSRTFDLDVSIADSTLDDELVTVSFASESVDQVLATITGIVGAEFSHDGRKVVIRRATRVKRGAVPVPASLITTQANH